MRRESWILGVLLVFFVAATAYYTQRGAENQQRAQPTTFSTGESGTRALFDLLHRQGIDARRFERPFTELPRDGGLLIMFEPIEREMTDAEQTSVLSWLRGGGALLLITSEKGIGHGIQINLEVDPRKPDRPAILPPSAPDSPYMRDVAALHVSGTIRLKPTDPKKQMVLVADDQGAYAVSWREGKGSVIVVTDGLGAGNESLKESLAAADNAVFFLNVAQANTRPGRSAVLFDEYHQGFGEEVGTGKSVWQVMGAPLRSAFWYALALFMILLYNANKRFGRPIEFEPLSSRPSTEYISSMAGFFRRAGAAPIALETIYHHFVRDIAVRVDAPPAAPPERLAELAARRFGWTREEFQSLLARCEAAIREDDFAAKGRAGVRQKEAEIFRLAQQIQDYRRRAELVRPF